ncbi:sulfite exporter TauE/SafE family protein [Tessaracoccus caeni]|uniref:sulfite exporter TauE/SafE family protein n=1 Tax=Tessaracoccus caeni TaxID=3031239 RepID=UPI0023DC80C7|nr:sulfite exporter TauE/SafE family protein [Tessaracoccus caeni]MDF1488153.1 sulfite exporter TauE/SafE family protein [Tessaracoccus caeni]
MNQDMRPAVGWLLLVGAAAGLLSGMFGIGGGTIIVPALALWLGMPQKLAVGTSVAAILPTAVVGAASYAWAGNVDWIAAACLALGIVVGAQFGSLLLAKLPTSTIQWSFMVFLAIVIVSLWFVVPARDQQIDVTLLSGALLVVLGLVTGVLGGILGVGGGIIVVPMLMFFFGANDLQAKGTSLLMMIPGSISGTLGNVRRKNVDLRAAVAVGLSACVLAPVGTAIAGWVDPLVGNIAFSLYLAFILGQMLTRKLKEKRSDAS